MSFPLVHLLYLFYPYRKRETKLTGVEKKSNSQSNTILDE